MSLSSFAPSLLGGILIGAAAGGFHLFVGEIAGISGLYRRAIIGPSRLWRLAFLAGLLAAGALATWWGPVSAATALATLTLPVAVLAGLLVGIGSGLANGCTSGHGVCGLARLSPRSAVAVPVFLVTAILTVLISRHGLPW